MNKSNIVRYRGHLIELRRVSGGWATSFRKYARVEFTDVGQPFPSKREAITHAKFHIDWEINEEMIAIQFEDLFTQLLQQHHPLALIFNALATATYHMGWSEQSGLLEKAVEHSPGVIR